MGKMNIHKINGSTQIPTERQNNVDTPANDPGQRIGNRTALNADRIDFSNRASEVTRLVDQVKQLPDIREAEVAAIREKIASGEFEPSGDTIAGAILNDERS